MRLRRPCEHGRYDDHWIKRDTRTAPDKFDGEFLADDTLIKVRWCQEHLTGSANQFEAEQWICPAWALLDGKTTECRMVEGQIILDALDGETP